MGPWIIFNKESLFYVWEESTLKYLDGQTPSCSRKIYSSLLPRYMVLPTGDYISHFNLQQDIAYD